MNLPQTIAVVGGVDPGGGAGLLRDLFTAVARGARPHAIGTAWTDQAAGVHRVEPRPAEAIRTALRELVGRPDPVRAVKVGMAVDRATAAAIVDGLGGYDGPVVVDPVLESTRGGALWRGEPREMLPLLRRASLATPNAAEAAALTGSPVETADDAESAGRRLVDSDGVAAVLVKGGHLRFGDEAVEMTDVLVTRARTYRFTHPRLPGPGPRGTGCALATAIAVELASGADLPTAIDTATSWLTTAIARATPHGDDLLLPFS